MRIVVMGGTGLVGAKLVRALQHRGHNVLAASARMGVDLVTGEGVADALAGASVVIDVTNPRSFDAAAAMEYFQISSCKLLAAGAAAHVKHHIALSFVGTDLLTESGYFRAKKTQEELIRSAPIPHTILRSTQFFESMLPAVQEAPAHTAIRVAGTNPLQRDGRQIFRSRTGRCAWTGAANVSNALLAKHLIPIDERCIIYDALETTMAGAKRGMRNMLLARSALIRQARRSFELRV